MMEAGTGLSMWMREDSTGWRCIVRGCWGPWTQTQAVYNWWGKDVGARWISITQSFLILICVLFRWRMKDFLVPATQCHPTQGSPWQNRTIITPGSLLPQRPRRTQHSLSSRSGAAICLCQTEAASGNKETRATARWPIPFWSIHLFFFL